MMNNHGKQFDGHGVPPTGASPDASREISSEKLFAGHREILITHDDKTYRLRITNQGKLVLNL